MSSKSCRASDKLVAAAMGGGNLRLRLALATIHSWLARLLMWYQIDIGYANAGVRVEGGKVVEAAPIFKWMLGKDWSYVSSWPKIEKIVTVS